MADEFRNLVNGASNFEKRLFPNFNGGSLNLVPTINGGIWIDTDIKYLTSNDMTYWFTIFRYNTVLENLRKAPTGVQLDNQRNFFKGLVVFREPRVNNRDRMITFGDIDEMIRNGNLDSNIRVKLENDWGIDFLERDEHYNGIVDYMVRNFYFPTSLIAQRSFTRLSDGTSETLYMIQSSNRHYTFDTATRGGITPRSYISNERWDSLNDAFKDMILWAGKPPLIHRVGAVFIGYSLWSLSVTFRFFGASKQFVDRIITAAKKL